MIQTNIVIEPNELPRIGHEGKQSYPLVNSQKTGFLEFENQILISKILMFILYLKLAEPVSFPVMLDISLNKDTDLLLAELAGQGTSDISCNAKFHYSVHKGL
jgi:hypothetical protein